MQKLNRKLLTFNSTCKPKNGVATGLGDLLLDFSGPDIDIDSSIIKRERF